VNDRFQIEELLEIQDLGFLYLCRDLETGRNRARMRVLSADNFGSEVPDSLSGELSLLRRLRHPNLARTLGFGIIRNSGEVFLVEEWIEGKDICSGTEEMDPREIVGLLIEITRTLQYLHARGIVHGCLNPSNVVLSKSEATGNLKLLDFGLLRCLPNWSPWSRSRTVAYIAPEILMGQPVSERSDLYSLGILIYQLLTRRLPFDDADPGFLMQKHLQVNVDLGPIEQLRSSSGLSQLLYSLLDKDPSKRSGSAESIEQFLHSMIGGNLQCSEIPELERFFSGSRFVGREKEVLRLQQIANRVRTCGRGFTVFVVGEAGCGKTRCMEELRSWALLQGWRVVEGFCGAHEEKSYGPYRQVLAKADQTVGESIFQFDDAPREAKAESFESSPEFAAGQFRDLLTRELIRRLSGCPTLLFLHDFHLADEATSAVLDYLSADVQSHQILVCVSLRPGEESGSMSRVMEQAVRQGRGEILTLEGLTRENAELLVAGILGDNELRENLGTWMFKSTEGNPFFLEEMLKHLIEQGLLSYEQARWRLRDRDLLKSEIPASIGAVLQRRLNQLSPLSRALANWPALFQRPISKTLLAAVAGLSDEDLARALQQLKDRQIIRTEMQDAGEAVELSHVLIGEVIRGELPQIRRRNMHCRIAELLERDPGTGDNLQELAMHAMEGRLGAKAVRLALALASRSHADFAHEKALHCFEYVFAQRGDLTEEELCRAAIEASDTMLALGMPKQAIRLLKSEMRRVCGRGAEQKALMLMQLAVSYKHLGNSSYQKHYCNKGLRYLRNAKFAEDHFPKAMLFAELAFISMMQSKPRLGLKFTDRALASCLDPDKGALPGRILNLTASLYRVACQLQKALASCKRAIDILSRSEKDYLTCSAYSTMGLVLMGLGRLSLAFEKHQQAVALSEKGRSVILRSQALANMVECLLRMGRIKEAVDFAEGALRFVSESNNPAMTYAFNTILAESHLALCEYGATFEIINQLERKPLSNSARYVSGHAELVAASVNFAVGDFDTALKHIHKLIRAETLEAPFYERELVEALKARILFERGQSYKAIKQLGSLYKRVAKKHWPYQMCIIKLHLSEVLLEAGLLSPAEKAAKDSLRLARGMQSAHLIGQSHFLLGRFHSLLASSSDGNELHLDLAVKEMQAACAVMNSPVLSELTWRIHAELSLLFARLSDQTRCLDHAEKAYDQLCKLESRVPPEMLPAYLKAFDRNRLKADIMQVIETRREQKRNTSSSVAEFRDSENSRILLRVSTAVSSILDLNQLLEGILDQLITAVQVERAFMLLRDEATGKLRIAKGRNYRQETLFGAELAKGSIFEYVLEQENPIVSANGQTDPRLNHGLTQSPDVGKLFCAPLKVPGRVLGVLYADHSAPSEGLSESEVNLFAAFCNLAAIAIDNAMAHQQLAKETSELQQYLHQARDGYLEIVGKSTAVEALRDRIGLAAASPLDILIVGESGTGKELVARAIHRTGRRKSGKFIPVDCGSLSDTLAEAELFGYRKGAFTGAVENRQGLLEAAQGGIIFLDEISNLPFHLQAKLLRVLQEREVRRIGETMPRKIDIQVLAATNKDPLEEIKKGKFRRDLYYRLRIMEIRVPPLRDRSGDIPLLLEWFLEQIAQSEGGRSKKFSRETVEILNTYHYPGNIRELKNIIAEAYYSAKGDRIDVNVLPLELRRIDTTDSSVHSDVAARLYSQIAEGLGDFERLVRKPFMKHQFGASVVREIIERALRESKGNYRDAFSLLKIPGRRYAMTMQFLKRHNCYVDFRSFRRIRPQ
jgi:transcriptional regulator with GAF, ATPase, and Fis domain